MTSPFNVAIPPPPPYAQYGSNVQPTYCWPQQMHQVPAPVSTTTMWNPSVPPPPPFPPPPPPTFNYAPPAGNYTWDPIGNMWTMHAGFGNFAPQFPSTVSDQTSLDPRLPSGTSMTSNYVGAADHSNQSAGPWSANIQQEAACSNVEVIDQKEADQRFVNSFFAARSNYCEKATEKNIDIASVRVIIKQCVCLIKELKSVHDALKDALPDDDLLWRTLGQRVLVLQNKIKASLEQITSGNKLQSLKRKLKKIQKKRERIRRQKVRKNEEKAAKEKRTKLVHEKLDTWLRSIRQEYLDTEMEKKMKKEADSILSEVRRKKAEATRTLALVKSVEKLRAAKKKSAVETKALFSSAESDKRFADAVTRFESTLSARLLEYSEEERTLQAMLDEECRETRDAEERRRLQEHEDRVDIVRYDIIRSLFGSEVIDKRDPLFYYWEFYTRTERDLDALIHVRREWDMWLVPNGSTSSAASNVPAGWVKPSEPSSDAWLAVLDK